MAGSETKTMPVPPGSPMKALAFAAFVAIASAATTIAFGIHGPVDQLTTSQADAWLARGAVLLDVRDPLQFELDHDPRARNIAADDIVLRYRELPRGRTIVVVCADANDCHRATFLLRASGFDAREVETPNPE